MVTEKTLETGTDDAHIFDLHIVLIFILFYSYICM
jgi:hypothetical protein